MTRNLTPQERFELSADQPLEVLREAVRILREGRWCQLHFARNLNGRSVSVYNDSAETFCLSGAICRAVFNLAGGDYDWITKRFGPLDKIRVQATQCVQETLTLMYGFEDMNGRNNIVEWNDAGNRKIEDVIAVLERAISDRMAAQLVAETV